MYLTGVWYHPQRKKNPRVSGVELGVITTWQPWIHEAYCSSSFHPFTLLRRVNVRTPWAGIELGLFEFELLDPLDSRGYMTPILHLPSIYNLCKLIQLYRCSIIPLLVWYVFWRLIFSDFRGILLNLSFR